MVKYRFEEHGVGYHVGHTLRPWRPQYPIIVSWVPRGSTVFDVGCGDGALGEMLIEQKGCSVSGIDLDETGVKEARRKGVHASVADADKKFPFPDKKFDIVVCTEVLEFVKRPDFVVSECLRVGEKAIIAFPNFGFWFYRVQMFLGKFPQFSLYGHQWWNTSQTTFFSFADFMDLPAMRRATVNRFAGIDWMNRHPSLLAKLNPNFFARSCILELEDRLLRRFPSGQIKQR